ncbi:MAG TPA: hypothetical protein VHG32_20110 [Thermoanaerobaculia bacterium]|nr:hypothetical protein [Thermoanaerobaculia bacterium]
MCVDQSKTAPNKWRKFDYVFYVRTGGPQALAFKFAADPIGKFYDQMATARIALTRDQTALTCALQFPVYSMVVMDLLSADTGKQTASLQGEQLFQVALRSLVPDLDILLTEPVQVYCDLNLWESCSARFVNLRRMGGDNTLPLSPSAPALEIRAIPRSFKALARSLLPFSGDGASTPAAGDPGAGEGGTVHDHLTVAFSYKTRGGLDRVFTHRFPVRFVPGFWSLLLAVAAGVVVGSMIPLAFGKVRVKEWGKAAAAAILLGILVEAFAMVVVKLDSTVQIFRFKLDPFQILPTALLGALVGIRGRKNADALDKVFRTLAAGGANRSEG